ncbi:MFS transporter [Nocardioides mangrovi]|uniref:MFS transporter n=1 Tax=Nocardioides mangrovi TaxID=2874580 RepID=A0ABS7UHA0_9ACTN|nr:MFS transporter [Nocardioides mangrovi]MBZ5740418.1 MFS transporter [Nocardioides mangrovi]
MPTRLDRFLPPTPLARRLSAQSVLFATGEGAFLTGSAVFFTQIVGLSAAQVGLGLTVGGLASFCCSIPAGKLADRLGPKRLWGLSAFTMAALYLVWPFIGGFATFLVLVVLLEVVQNAGWSGRGAYTIDIFPREERVRTSAFVRAALNIGFTIGALIGGLALASDSDTVIRAVPWLTACVLLANGVMITRLPDAPHDKPTAEDVVPVEKAVQGSALRNRGFVLLNVCDGILGTNQVLLNIVIPLWLVQETDAPHVLLAWLFGTNTVLAVLLQVPAARGVDSVSSSLRAARISGAFFVLSCLIVLVTHDTLGWTTILLVWLGHVTVTGAELFQSAGHWGFLSELSDPDRRGEYQGAAQLGSILGNVWAPALFTYLAMEWGTTGWLLIAAIIVVGVLGMGPSSRAAERYLARVHADAAA